MSTFANSEDHVEMQHSTAFHHALTVCKGKKDLQTKGYNIFENYNLTLLDIYNGHSQVYSSKQEDKSISIQKVNSNYRTYLQKINDVNQAFR